MADVSSKLSEKNVETKPNVTKDAGRKSFSGLPFGELEHFVNEDDQYLFCKTWKPKVKEPRALLLILPSATQHNEWFSELAENIVELGVLVFAHDYVGHGESEGHRCHVEKFEDYLRDILQHINIMKSEYPGLPLYIFGHSVGGALGIILACEDPNLCNGLILSNPAIICPLLPIGPKLFFVKAVSLVMPRLELFSYDPSVLTRSPEAVKKYKSDPRIYHGKMRAQLAVQLMRAFERVRELLPELSVPVLVHQGEKDIMCDVSGSEELMRVAKTEDKTLKVYEGALHELLYEIDDVPQRFLNDTKEWLQKHIPK